MLCFPRPYFDRRACVVAAVGVQDVKKEAPKAKEAPKPAKPAWNKVGVQFSVISARLSQLPCAL
jgi:hypothetical protein